MSVALGPWPVTLLDLVSLTGTQGRQCHRVGGGEAFPSCLVFQRSSLWREWWAQDQGISLPFQHQKRSRLGKKVCETEVGTVTGIWMTPEL